MIGKKETPLLIDVVDIVEICERAGTVDSIDIAICIEKAFKAIKRSEFEQSQHLWLYYKLLGTIYDAGRIQGIREERVRHKEEQVLSNSAF